VNADRFCVALLMPVMTVAHAVILDDVAYRQLCVVEDRLWVPEAAQFDVSSRSWMSKFPADHGKSLCDCVSLT
jgi:hypothetical protein